MRFISILFIFLFSACSIQNAMKPARKAGFIEYKDYNLYDDIIPFEYVWAKKNRGEAKQDFDKLSINIIPFKYLDTEHWKDSKSIIIRDEKEFFTAVNHISKYFYDQLAAVMKKETIKHKRDLKIVDLNTDEDFRLEIAFTEMSFGHPITSGISMLIPLPFMSYLFDTTSSPYASFEARVVNNKTNEVFVELADKKFPKIKIIDFNKLTSESSVKEIMQIWAREIVDSFLAKSDQNVHKEGIFSIKPW